MVKSLFIGITCLSLLSAPALAQVGHVAESSPYKDMRIKQALVFYGGYLSGGRGSAGVGPSAGPLGGVRWEVTVGAPSVLFLGVTFTNLERALVNPADPPDTRFFGVANQQIVMLNGGFNMVLTGRKTWHGFAPYAGFITGVAFGGAVPEDSSGFNFKTKFHVGPTVGLRIHPSPRFHIRIEGRATLWKLFNDPTNAPGTDPLLDPILETDSDWTIHPTLLFGIGYTLRR
jgi:hypothetical protein